jgi:DNA-directed RNA polymerase subunit beta'
VIVRQMMRKVTIEDAGDTKFLEGDTEDRLDFMDRE